VEVSGVSREISFNPRAGSVECEADDSFPEGDLRLLTRRIFSFDDDLEEFHVRAAADPRTLWAARRGAGRFLRAPSLWEDAVKMLLTTNCSWAATKGMVRRLVDELGTGGAFPGPDVLAGAAERYLRQKTRCGYRAPALRAFAKRVASKKTRLSEWEDRRRTSEEVRRQILQEPGFGPYAAEALMRLLGRHEFFAVDSWCVKKYRQMYRVRGSLLRSINRRYGSYGCDRGLAFWLDLTRDWHEGRDAL
jgi:N-glycosylase/DNA lyase